VITTPVIVNEEEIRMVIEYPAITECIQRFGER
jgi:hypothetical protein